MSKCNDCCHHYVCRILEKAEEFNKQLCGAAVGVTECDHYLVAIEESKQFKTGDVLDRLGLGENINPGYGGIALASNNTIESNVVENGKLCPSCGKIVSQNKFLGDKCCKCGEEICEDCVIEIEGGTICEKCF